MSWKVIITASAKKELKRLPEDTYNEISKIIDRIAVNPFEVTDLKKLSEQENIWRIRKGNYRIKFELFQKEKAVFIYSIKRRTSTTY